MDVPHIDIAAVLAKRAPNKRIPKFLVNYLRKIVHEEEFNTFFNQNPGVKNIEFIEVSRNRESLGLIP